MKKNISSSTFYSHGKLLLSGEYTVLDGALSLALPTKYGQKMTVTTTDSGFLEWNNYDHEGKPWYSAHFGISNNKFITKNSTDEAISKTLIKLLDFCASENPDFLKQTFSKRVDNYINFPREWGLGTSSTFINNLANWANTNPYNLLWNAFGGSGYDIGCAAANGPIWYQIIEKQAIVSPITFSPSFTDDLFFVYLNQKQQSKSAIAAYRKLKDSPEVLTKISSLTKEITQCQYINEFETLINTHESIMSEVLKQTTVKERLFNDYMGSIKSLGAWGGDFVLATRKEALAYFPNKGYKTVIPYADMVL